MRRIDVEGDVETQLVTEVGKTRHDILHGVKTAMLACIMELSRMKPHPSMV